MDTDTGFLILNFTAHNATIRCLAVLSNGNLASASNDKTIKIWNPLNGSLIRILTGHSNWVISVIELLNGDLASGSKDTNPLKQLDYNRSNLLHLKSLRLSSTNSSLISNINFELNFITI